MASTQVSNSVQNIIRMKSHNMVVLIIFSLMTWFSQVSSKVSYDSRAILINGKRTILISGSIHYPRSTPEMWPELMQKAKDGGLDVIQTYVFWNGHEPSPGKYFFEGRYDLVHFIKLAQKAGLYVHLRIGPYVCAEWNFGGFPIWLKYVHGIAFRTDNEPFKAAMQKFTEKIVNMMKAEKLFEPQGGPIILTQIENEYELVEYGLGEPGKAYSKWSAEMALGLGTQVPWVMCKQKDAIDPIINSWNGFYSDNFLPNKNYKPKMWTEAWTGWLLKFGGPTPSRPVQDLAFAVTKFIQNGGAYINYYMFHGGTNFGRTAGGPFIATSYDYDALIDEYGLAREPKYSHLRELHKTIRKCQPALVSAKPIRTSLGTNQEAHVFDAPQSGACAAFLSNYDSRYSVNVTFRKRHFGLPPWSISILPDCREASFNTAKIGAAKVNIKMEISKKFSWQSYTEGIPSFRDKNSFEARGLYDQLNITRDASDYLWYTAEVHIKDSDTFLTSEKRPVLVVSSAGHALQVFINNQLSGIAYGSFENPKLSFSGEVTLKSGVNKISLLSVSVGLPNVGLRFETWDTGVLGPVILKALDGKKWDLSQQKWSYKIGVEGENLRLYSSKGSLSVKWAKGSAVPKNKAMTWYKTTFEAPEGKEPVALDMSTMGKGQMWMNGQSLGRHWPAYRASGRCSRCSYAGTYHEDKCLHGCGEATHKWYHVPRSWLRQKGNVLVVFEEQGGDPAGMSLIRRTTP